MKRLSSLSGHRRKSRRREYAAAVRTLLTAGNTKIGEHSLSFSIPAGPTCVGKTTVCGRKCYARRGHFAQYRNRIIYEEHFKASLLDSFVGRVAGEIDGRRGPVRIHVAGDFYSEAYVRKWVAVATLCPGTTFWAYTRSWRDPALLPALVELSRLPNVTLWWSEDAETGRSPYFTGIRVAFMVTGTADEGLVPDYADLVFRDPTHVRAAGALHKINGVPVCPYEWDAQPPRPAPPTTTCAACRLCIDRPAPQRRVVVDEEEGRPGTAPDRPAD